MAILPIVTYDDPVLTRKAETVKENSEELQQLIRDLFDTMYNAEGVGLAAPQVGHPIRVFVMDADPMTEDDDEKGKLGPMTLINPEITRQSETLTEFEEGCLSIPEVRENVKRPEKITITYLDRDFNPGKLTVDRTVARVMQHELDHLDGILFIDRLGSFRKRLLKTKLKQVAEGNVQTGYPLRTPQPRVS